MSKINKIQRHQVYFFQLILYLLDSKATSELNRFINK